MDHFNYYFSLKNVEAGDPRLHDKPDETSLLISQEHLKSQTIDALLEATFGLDPMNAILTKDQFLNHNTMKSPARSRFMIVESKD